MSGKLLSLVTALSVMAAPATAGSPDVAGEWNAATWVKRPTEADLAAVWPEKALDAGRDGKVILQCELAVEGLLDHCVVYSEDPPGLGYGDAALLLTPQFRMKPAIRGGVPIVSRVRLPIVFNGAMRMRGAVAGSMMVRPFWDAAPTRADVLAAYPAKSVLSGNVMMDCLFSRGGTLRDCNLVSESPHGAGFAKAARSLLPMFRNVSAGPGGKSLNGVSVRVPFYFGPHGVTPPFTPEALNSALQWVNDSGTPHTDALYPEKARAAGGPTGRVTLICVSQVKGRLGDCRVDSEAPPDVGFGDMALTTAARLRINPWSADGRPMDGVLIRLPLRFEDPSKPERPAKP